MHYSLAHTFGQYRAGRLDPDAKAYIAAVVATGVTVTATQRTAVDTFYKTAKDDGYYTSLKRLYLPIWGAAAANAIDMITLTSGTFVGGVTHGSGFVQGNGTTGYFNFGVTPDSLGMSVNGGMHGILVNQAPTTALRRLISAQNFSSPVDIFERVVGTVSGISRTGASSSSISLTTTSDISGVFTHTRANNTSQRLSVRKTAGVTNAPIETSTATGSIPQNIVALARNAGGTISAFSDLRAGSYFAADGGFTYSHEPNFTLNLKTLWESCTGLTLP